jgi:hypothetical protein
MASPKELFDKVKKTVAPSSYLKDRGYKDTDLPVGTTNNKQEKDFLERAYPKTGPNGKLYNIPEAIEATGRGVGIHSNKNSSESVFGKKSFAQKVSELDTNALREEAKRRAK